MPDPSDKPSAPPRSVIGDLRTELLDGEDPYAAADPAMRDEGYPHTFLPSDLVLAVGKAVHPGTWLEIGSMVGGSAIRAARCLPYAEVVCLDPFTGDVNAWAGRQEARRAGQWDCLRLDRGRPRIYERFLANVAGAKQTFVGPGGKVIPAPEVGSPSLPPGALGNRIRDRVLPLVVTGVVGCGVLLRLFREGRLCRLPEVVYLDAAHEEDETFLEVRRAWALLPPGGVLFGDDWDWPGVERAVRVFASKLEKESSRRSEEILMALPRGSEPKTVDGRIHLYRNQWILVK